MFSNKKILLILIVLIVSVLSMGCMNKIEEKIGTSIGEKIVEKTTGQEIDVDTDEQSVTMKSEGMTVQSGENLDWPSDKMGNLPDPGGNIISIAEIEEGNSTRVMTEFGEDEEVDVKEYIKQVEDLGYVEGSINESDIAYLYIGYKEESTRVGIDYMAMFNTISVWYAEDDDEDREFFENN